MRKKSNLFPPEVRERAVRMVQDRRGYRLTKPLGSAPLAVRAILLATPNID